MKFKVGDRVRAIGSVDDLDLTEKTGTVKRIHNSIIGVEFDEYFSGHDLDGYGKDGYCRWGSESEFELLANNKKIVITTDGKETLARLYEGNKVIKKATAVCFPDDTFDFETGAKIAFDRLIGGEAKPEEKPKYFSGKVVCVSAEKGYAYTVGKIYEFVDGRVKLDNGVNYCPSKPIIDLEDFNKYFSTRGKFIPLVEE